jgi:hypothetical protein
MLLLLLLLLTLFRHYHHHLLLEVSGQLKVPVSNSGRRPLYRLCESPPGAPDVPRTNPGPLISVQTLY